jgi:uncharacterized protein (UPF0548 family)
VTEFNYRGPRTLSGRAPEGYRITELSRVIGAGDVDFDRARHAIAHWRIQSGSRYVPITVPEQAEVGVVSQFRIPFGPLRPTVTCRVFAVIDEPDVAGFAHEAIRGHPQSGWESFLVERAGNGELTLRIRVVSRPSAWWMRLAGPAGRLALVLLLQRNLHSLDSALIAPSRPRPTSEAIAGLLRGNGRWSRQA